MFVEVGKRPPTQALSEIWGRECFRKGRRSKDEEMANENSPLKKNSIKVESLFGTAYTLGSRADEKKPEAEICNTPMAETARDSQKKPEAEICNTPMAETGQDSQKKPEAEICNTPMAETAQDSQKKPEASSRRKGSQTEIQVLYKDRQFAAVIKPVGILSEGGEGDMVSLLSEKFSCKVYPVHRLDRAVGGVMIYAVTKESASKLSRIMESGGFVKEYLAVVHGECLPCGVMEDLLFKDSRLNKSFVVKRERRGVKKASLEYERLGFDGEKSLVKIRLHTGRSHQIRVQFSSRKMALYGDGKYGGSDNCQIALVSHRVSFEYGGKEYNFEGRIPSSYPFSDFCVSWESEKV